MAPAYRNRGIVMDQLIQTRFQGEPWNKGKLVGQKAPLRLKDISAIRRAWIPRRTVRTRCGARRPR